MIKRPQESLVVTEPARPRPRPVGLPGENGEIAALLRQAASAHRLAEERLLADLGVTPPQLAALTLIGANPGFLAADLARRAKLTPQTVSLIVANLQRAGAVARRAHDVHGRIQHLDVTPAGRALLARCKRRVDVLEARLLGGLSARDEKAIRAWLVRVALGDVQPSNAATPGKVLPSSHSRKAPPAVET